MRRTITVAVVLMIAAAAWATPPEKCGGADIANGPFHYTALGTSAFTFNGTGGFAVNTTFSITAPSASPDDPAVPNVFAGQGQNACLGQADASILALEVQKVGDSNGNAIDPIVLDPSAGLGLQIISAFILSPSSHSFTPGESINVNVTVNNPGITSSDYGDYDVKLAAQAPGAGIGVGDGPHFTLRLRGASWTDTAPPDVTVTKPAADQILGTIPIEVQAIDPVGSHLEGTGVASMSAKVSSAGDAVSDFEVQLTIDYTLPVLAGVTVTATGSFVPFGGSGPAGTTDALAFSATAPSGIGTYTINAQATDLAGNIGSGAKTFNVSYQVAFSRLFSTNPCKTGGNSSCTGQFEFTVNRSNVTSDGAVMYDHTVVAKLKRVADNAYVGASHYYGTGDLKTCVQIDSTPVYKTNFRRADIGASGPTAYVLEVYFQNVDGQEMLQATSAAVTF